MNLNHWGCSLVVISTATLFPTIVNAENPEKISFITKIDQGNVNIPLTSTKFFLSSDLEISLFYAELDEPDVGIILVSETDWAIKTDSNEFPIYETDANLLIEDDSPLASEVDSILKIDRNVPLVSQANFTLATNQNIEPNIFNNLLSDKTRNNTPLFLADGESRPPSGTTIYWSPARPDSHAPIGVMGEHTHGKGEVMLSYRYMFMEMDGSRDGTDSISDAAVLEQFPITPTRMTMQMHMLGAMYAPTEDLTMMVMLPYVIKDMDHITRMGRRFSTHSDGIGDIKLAGLYKFVDRNQQRLHFNLGVSFPTGSIEERDDTPAASDQILPYPMQIGSGTFDLNPGITYLGQGGNWSWGAQALGVIRLGENSNSYRLGNQLMLTGWGARKVADWVSLSLRMEGRTWGNIDGQDSRLNPNLVPTADPDRRGGTQIDLGFGVNFYLPKGNLKGGRFAFEFKLPIYRDLDGPQLETDWQLTAGIQASI